MVWWFEANCLGTWVHCCWHMICTCLLQQQLNQGRWGCCYSWNAVPLAQTQLPDFLVMPGNAQLTLSNPYCPSWPYCSMLLHIFTYFWLFSWCSCVFCAGKCSCPHVLAATPCCKWQNTSPSNCHSSEACLFRKRYLFNCPPRWCWKENPWLGVAKLNQFLCRGNELSHLGIQNVVEGLCFVPQLTLLDLR